MRGSKTQIHRRTEGKFVAPIDVTEANHQNVTVLPGDKGLAL